MSEKATTYLLLPEASEELITSEPWSIETYADGLMDELFSEIDEILDGGGDNFPSRTVHYGSRLKSGHPPTELPQEVIHHLQTITVPPIVLPDTQIGHVQPVSKVRNNPLSTVVAGTPTVQRPVDKPSKKKSRRPIGIVLWVLATAGLAIAGMAWAFNSGFINRLVSKSLQQSLLQQSQVQPQLPTKLQVQADLIDYMLGALSVIEKQEARSNFRSSAKPMTTAVAPANQTALAYIAPQPTGNLPPPVAANNTAPSSRPATIVERIYIPVYQAPQPMRYALPSIPGTPKPPSQVVRVPKKTLGSKAAPANIALNKEQKTTKPANTTAIASVRQDIKPVTVQTKPVTVRQATQPNAQPATSPAKVAPPKLPAATAPQPEPEQQQVVAVVSRPNLPAYTLEGLLELGKKSAALFNVGGITRRVEIGEAIGSSGWTLVDVANGEAIIRRNGEVRSIFAGQTF
jgi:Tfp pilus assembly protein PilP